MSSKSGLLGLIVSLIGLSALFGVYLLLVNKYYYDVDITEDNKEEEVDKNSWIPEGFNIYDNNVAFKLTDPDTYTCRAYVDRCLQMEVISRKGCDRLYAEVVKLDDDGNNVGYTNDTTAGLAPNQKAVLKFDTYGEFKTFQLSKISCY